MAKQGSAEWQREQRVLAAWHSWQAGDADKWDFYRAAIDSGLTMVRVAELTRLDPKVVEDRMRYLRRLARDSDSPASAGMGAFFASFDQT